MSHCLHTGALPSEEVVAPANSKVAHLLDAVLTTASTAWKNTSKPSAEHGAHVLRTIQLALECAPQSPGMPWWVLRNTVAAINVSASAVEIDKHLVQALAHITTVAPDATGDYLCRELHHIHTLRGALLVTIATAWASCSPDVVKQAAAAFLRAHEECVQTPYARQCSFHTLIAVSIITASRNVLQQAHKLIQVSKLGPRSFSIAEQTLALQALLIHRNPEVSTPDTHASFGMFSHSYVLSPEPPLVRLGDSSRWGRVPAGEMLRTLHPYLRTALGSGERDTVSPFVDDIVQLCSHGIHLRADRILLLLRMNPPQTLQIPLLARLEPIAQQDATTDSAAAKLYRTLQQPSLSCERLHANSASPSQESPEIQQLLDLVSAGTWYASFPLQAATPSMPCNPFCAVTLTNCMVRMFLIQVLCRVPGIQQRLLRSSL